MGSLQEFIAKRRAAGVTNRTINHALAVVRRIVNLAATEWRDRMEECTRARGGRVG